MYLTAEKGYCYASNSYLAKQFDTNEITISRKLGILKNKGYITIEYEKRGYEVIGRKIRLTKMLTDGYQKKQPTVNKNDKYNNISNNIISIKNKFSKQQHQEFNNDIPDNLNELFDN